MSMRDLIPWGRQRNTVPSTGQGDDLSPILALHREMNRLFDDVFSRFDHGLPSVFGRMPSWPSIEVDATDKEVRVSAELPGIDEKDIEILVDDGVLTIRGEKRAESEDKDRQFSERYYGRFERRVALPYEVEEDKAEASFRNGVLTVSLPKSPKAQEKTRRITVNRKSDTKH